MKIKIRNIYGIDKFYPVDEEAELFAELLKVKTFSESQLSIIHKLTGLRQEQSLPIPSYKFTG